MTAGMVASSPVKAGSEGAGKEAHEFGRAAREGEKVVHEVRTGDEVG